MKLVFNFVDGEKSIVTVNGDEEWYITIKESRKEEHALNERERYHSEWSLDDTLYEGIDFSSGYQDEVEYLAERRAEYQRVTSQFGEFFKVLTETQRRRFILLYIGFTIAEIAVIEGKNYASIKESLMFARNKLKEQLKDFPDMFEDHTPI